MDTRDDAPYTGLERYSIRSQHISGASHYFWKDALLDDGSWKLLEQLRERFASLPKKEEIIVSCGYVSLATPNVLDIL
ncbi:hypothetical protein [Paenibacillus sp. NPDC057967]|uniref:hypothetical protein n=1 Tax=Paenibacillus sp. NPDC057967 TaxID=3346293 RepID=UPI0036DBDEDF